MLAGIRSRLTYANVMASIAVFIALGAGAYAAGLAPNSVKSKNIVDGQVKARDISPSDLHSAGLSSDVFCTIGTWQTATDDPVSYYRDPLGQVQLTGVLLPCNPSAPAVFTLPEGFRPAAHDFPAAEVALPVSGGDQATLSVQQDGEVSVQPAADGDVFSLNGLGFRCGPSGQDGCP